MSEKEFKYDPEGEEESGAKNTDYHLLSVKLLVYKYRIGGDLVTRGKL